MRAIGTSLGSRMVLFVANGVLFHIIVFQKYRSNKTNHTMIVSKST